MELHTMYNINWAVTDYILDIKFVKENVVCEEPTEFKCERWWCRCCNPTLSLKVKVLELLFGHILDPSAAQHSNVKPPATRTSCTKAQMLILLILKTNKHSTNSRLLETTVQKQRANVKSVQSQTVWFQKEMEFVGNGKSPAEVNISISIQRVLGRARLWVNTWK